MTALSVTPHMTKPVWDTQPHELPKQFLHFTSLESASSMTSTSMMWLSATITNAVFAVAVGASNIPSVQHACRRTPQSQRRECGVLFEPTEMPDMLFPEEVIWHRRCALDIKVLDVLDVTAAESLLDGSAGIEEPGWWHSARCVCAPCTVYTQTVGL